MNSKKHLIFGGCDTVSLAKKFGTPLYVISEEIFRKKCREYKSAFTKYYQNFDIAYAGKANLSKQICRIIKDEKLSLDVSSGGEIYTALSVNFPPQKIYFHGNNKSVDEIELALKNNIGRFVVDNEQELENLKHLCKKLKKEVNILVRITPNIKPTTHNYIQTGQIDSKFGIPIGEDAIDFIKKVLECKYIKLKGLHSHIGSQIFDLVPFKIAAQIMVSFINDIKNRLGISIDELNLGGGLGIKYLPEHNPPKIEEYVKTITSSVKESCKSLGIALPKIIVEPGRSIVGEAGITLYTVGAIKEIKDIRKYILVDGGMTDNIRTALYNAKYHAVVANKVGAKPDEVVSIAGKCCESGDMLIWDIKLPKIEVGDILAVFSTGAYNYSMASNYNRLVRPATVLVNKGKAKLIVKRESYDDIIRNDI